MRLDISKKSRVSIDDCDVEIRAEDQNYWYFARALEVTPKGLVVEYPVEDWEPEIVTQGNVRARSYDLGIGPFEAGMAVDVLRPESGKFPNCLATGKIDRIEGNFVFVLCNGSTSPIITEKTNVRKADFPRLDIASLQHVDCEVPEVLKVWVGTPDGLGCLQTVARQCGVLRLEFQPGKAVAFGTPSNARRAIMILGIHIKHQVRLQEHNQKREKSINVLETVRNRIKELIVEQFTINSEFVGSLLGKKGSNINRVTEQYNTEVTILDGQTSKERIVRIVGKTEAAVKSTREELEFFEKIYELSGESLEFLRKRVDISAVTSKSQVRVCKLQRDGVLLFGTHPSLEDAIMMLEAHLQYMPIYKDMGKEIASSRWDNWDSWHGEKESSWEDSSWWNNKNQVSKTRR